ncbi:MAG: Vitamin K epoxide reductase [Candidatus Nomurabacteria bacterium GW2011_GWF2_40_12]|uniref:Vitamin K epoxide reductase n=1 Tax=Candidatus Nomurabacteria bacterium GW2011_GWF2_40_12 TaxID=1618776 RepID=A0A0G0T7R9_9BACT|nr:MAG: Vitamin K epoxide reductase [Candidatus Nomurabacteria bacterium GW2011_GWF2_40_12]
MDKNIKIFVSIIILLVLGTITTVVMRMDSTVPVGPGKYDAFATCLKDEGAVFYGAFWCTHCQATKKMFGASQKLLPYVECSTADGRGQVQMCADKKIMSYPTWEFADGSRLEGEVTFEQLALKTSCQLPL